MRKLFTFLVLLVSASLFAQGPWTQQKGKIYSQLSFTTIPSYTSIFGEPEQELFGTFTDNSVQLYGEYGISDKTTVTLNVPLKLIAIKDFEDPRVDCIDCTFDFSKTAIGNIEVGVKHNFYNKDWLLSGQVSIESNTGSYDEVSGIRTGYDAFTFTPLFLAGRSFGKTYLQGFIGAQLRTNDYSSNFKVGGEVGTKLIDKIWLVGFVDIVKSLENGTVELPQSNLLTGLYVDNQEYGAYGLKGIGEITDNFGVTAGFGGVFFANNLPKQAALNFGLYYKL